MKITIKKGINADGRNYRRIIYINDAGTEEEGSDKLSRMLTHTTSETVNGVFEERPEVRLMKGDHQLTLSPITGDMDDLTRAKIIVARIKTGREWADHIAHEITTTVEG